MPKSRPWWPRALPGCTTEVKQDFSPTRGGVRRRREGVGSRAGRARTGLMALLSLFLVATPAGALTCPTDQAMTPAQVLEAGLRSGSQKYDMAFVALVRSETTTQTDQVVAVELVGVYGSASAPATTTVTLGMPGVAGGSIDSFEVGTAYFIPVVAIGPADQSNYTWPCDPISVVDSPDTTAIDLAVISEASGIEFSLPGQLEGDGSGALVALVFVVVMGGLLFWTGKKRQASRRQLNATGSDPRPPQLPRL